MWLPGWAVAELTRYEARLCLVLAINNGLVSYSLKKKALSRDGVMAAILVGLTTLAAGYHFGAVLIAFFLSASKLTKLKASVKKRLDADYKPGEGQRNWVQVFSNGGFSTACCALLWWRHGGAEALIDYEADYSRSFLSMAVLGSYAAVCGDTWASEVGVLATSPPRLITAPWRRVPAGTNGGVSLLGLSVSLCGGAFIGATYWLVTSAIGRSIGPNTPPQFPVILIGAAAGLGGSIIDSVLGALLQPSYYDRSTRKITSEPSPTTDHVSGVALLDNHQVNLVMSCITSYATGLLADYVIHHPYFVNSVGF